MGQGREAKRKKMGGGVVGNLNGGSDSLPLLLGGIHSGGIVGADMDEEDGAVWSSLLCTSQT